MDTDESNLLSNFSSVVKGADPYKLVITLPESRNLILKGILTEILYSAVERSCERLFFITDEAGKGFLDGMLYDFHTGATDLKRLLLKFQSEKLKILTKGTPHELSPNEIAVFFRADERVPDVFIGSKEIIVLTLRDIHILGTSYETEMESLSRNGWIPLTFNLDGHEKSRKSDIFIETLPSDELDGFFDLVCKSAFSDPDIEKYTSGFGYFYATLPIPLKWYEYYKDADEPFRPGYNPGMLPSEALGSLPDISIPDSSILHLICKDIEGKLYDRNPKFEGLLNLTRRLLSEKQNIAVILPNQIICEAFVWGTDSIGRTLNTGDARCEILYPEKLFQKSLADTDTYDMILFPFSPSPEIILATQNLARQMVFVLYPLEMKMLEDSLQNSAAYNHATRLSICPSYDYSNNEIKSIRDKIKEMRAKETLVKPNWKMYENKVRFNEYSLFLKIISKNDPKNDISGYYEGRIDPNSYKFTSGEGKRFIVKGSESVIRYDKKATQVFMRYRWIAPRGIQIGDSVVMISNELKLKFFNEEVSRELKDKKEDVETFVKYIAQWKKALADVGRNYSFAEIQRRLEAKGLKRRYMTVRKWFEGLHDDPMVSAVVCLLDTKYNIGPEFESDIKIFGDTFEIRELSNNAKYIFAAMKVFRVSHQHYGKIAMTKIIQHIEDEDVRGLCTQIKVKKIDVLEYKAR